MTTLLSFWLLHLLASSLGEGSSRRVGGKREGGGDWRLGGGESHIAGVRPGAPCLDCDKGLLTGNNQTAECVGNDCLFSYLYTLYKIISLLVPLGF